MFQCLSLKSAVLILEVNAFPGSRFLGIQNNIQKSSCYRRTDFMNYFSAHLRVIPLWSRTLCSYILANWNSWSLNLFLILLMIHPLPLSSAEAPLPGGHVSRTRHWLPGHIPGWLEQRHAAAQAAQPCFPKEEAAGLGKAVAIPPSVCGSRPLSRLLQHA